MQGSARPRSRISELRGGRDIAVLAADLSARHAPIGIDHTDTVAVQDQPADMAVDGIDIVLETPGGLVEAVECIVGIVREKYERVGVIVPGCAKSASTVLAMAGDEILMGRASSLARSTGRFRRPAACGFPRARFSRASKR